MTVAEYAMIASTAAATFAAPIAISIRLLAVAFRELAAQLAGLREDVAELKGEVRGLASRRYSPYRGEVTSDDGSQDARPSAPSPGPTSPLGPLALRQNGAKR